MSPFKSDLEATIARAESAEQESERLRKENAALKNPAPQESPITKLPYTLADKYSLLAEIAFAIMWMCVVAIVLVPSKFFWPIFSLQAIIGTGSLILRIRARKLRQP